MSVKWTQGWSNTNFKPQYNLNVYLYLSLDWRGLTCLYVSGQRSCIQPYVCCFVFAHKLKKVLFQSCEVGIHFKWTKSPLMIIKSEILWFKISWMTRYLFFLLCFVIRNNDRLNIDLEVYRSSSVMSKILWYGLVPV